ncbi:MAG TPA: TIGR03619 family F420-dependent LLM class oxidoreductase [Actinomycetota bacterium]
MGPDPARRDLPGEFGLAVENFTPARAQPSIERILAYAGAAESLGYRSLWVWDHLFLGKRRPFPFLEALSTLAALSTRTSAAALGTGVLVLPLRDPVLLAKTAATVDLLSGGRLALGVAAGWYEREFQACGVPFKQRGRLFERNLEILDRLWREPEVSGTWDELDLRGVAMRPPPASRPRPPILIGGYVDRVLRRVATRGDGWLTYFYTPESFRRSWTRIGEFAVEAGRDPATFTNVAQVPLCVGASYEEADRRVRAFVAEYFDTPAWSESTPDSAIRGTPAQCAEQVAAYRAAGVRHLCLVPDQYQVEQAERFATEVLPLLGPLLGHGQQGQTGPPPGPGATAEAAEPTT